MARFWDARDSIRSSLISGGTAPKYARSIGAAYAGIARCWPAQFLRPWTIGCIWRNLHPQEHAALEFHDVALCARASTGRNGFEMAQAILPPDAARRGCCLIDPSYEVKNRVRDPIPDPGIAKLHRKVGMWDHFACGIRFLTGAAFTKPMLDALESAGIARDVAPRGPLLRLYAPRHRIGRDQACSIVNATLQHEQRGAAL